MPKALAFSMAQRLGSWQMGQRVGSVLSIYNFVLEEMTGIYTNAPGLIAQDFNLRQLCKKGGYLASSVLLNL
ncbi:MAG: hypothetical protein ACKO69_03055 [Limnohabitans sp.]